MATSDLTISMTKRPRIPDFKPSPKRLPPTPKSDPVGDTGHPSRFESLLDLSKYDPEKIIPRKDTHPFAMFMLALALIYNDHKGLFILSELLRTMATPPDGELSAHAGEFTGLDIQIYRLRVGMFREPFRPD